MMEYPVCVCVYINKEQNNHKENTCDDGNGSEAPLLVFYKTVSTNSLPDTPHHGDDFYIRVWWSVHHHHREQQAGLVVLFIIKTRQEASTAHLIHFSHFFFFLYIPDAYTHLSLNGATVVE